MNNLSTSQPSKIQNRWRSLPWGTFLFIGVVFVFATPLIYGFGLAGGRTLTSGHAIDIVADTVGGYNLGRQVALISLGAFATVSLLRRRRHRFQINGMLGWLILFYLALAVFSIMWSIDIRFTIKRVAILVMLSLGALYLANRLSLRQTMALIFSLNGIFVLSGIIITFLQQNFQPFNSGWRFGGNTHPIVQGWQCGLLILSSLALSKTAEKKRAVYYYGIALIAFFFLVFTRSRAPILAFIFGAALYVGLTESKRYQVTLVLGLVILGCLVLFLPDDVLMNYGVEVVTAGRGGEGLGSMHNLSGRIPLWKECLTSVHERPLLGHGYNSFFCPKNIKIFADKIGWVAATPHSGYMGTLLGLGYVGGVSLVIILFLSLKMSVRLAMRDPEYAFMAAVLVWLCINLTMEEDLLTRPYFAVLVWMIMLAKLGFLAENGARDT